MLCAIDAYSASPAAWRALALVVYSRTRTILPSRIVPPDARPWNARRTIYTFC